MKIKITGTDQPFVVRINRERRAFFEGYANAVGLPIEDAVGQYMKKVMVR